MKIAIYTVLLLATVACHGNVQIGNEVGTAATALRANVIVGDRAATRGEEISNSVIIGDSAAVAARTNNSVVAIGRGAMAGVDAVSGSVAIGAYEMMGESCSDDTTSINAKQIYISKPANAFCINPAKEKDITKTPFYHVDGTTYIKGKLDVDGQIAGAGSVQICQSRNNLPKDGVCFSPSTSVLAGYINMAVYYPEDQTLECFILPDSPGVNNSRHRQETTLTLSDSHYGAVGTNAWGCVDASFTGAESTGLRFSASVMDDVVNIKIYTTSDRDTPLASGQLVKNRYYTMSTICDVRNSRWSLASTGYVDASADFAAAETRRMCNGGLVAYSACTNKVDYNGTADIYIDNGYRGTCEVVLIASSPEDAGVTAEGDAEWHYAGFDLDLKTIFPGLSFSADSSLSVEYSAYSGTKTDLATFQEVKFLGRTGTLTIGNAHVVRNFFTFVFDVRFNDALVWTVQIIPNKVENILGFYSGSSAVPPIRQVVDVPSASASSLISAKGVHDALGGLTFRLENGGITVCTNGVAAGRIPLTAAN